MNMLGKLYVVDGSSVERLQLVRDLVVEAIDNRVAAEATSRTAMNKLHTAVSKALSEANIKHSTSDRAMACATPVDDLNNASNLQEEGGDDGDVDQEPDMDESVATEKDSVLQELLDDEDEVL